ncbi:Beta-galactosidase [subsurface metagenome]
MLKCGRRDFLKAVGLGAVASVVPRWMNVAVAAKSDGEAKPNIIFMLVDDWKPASAPLLTRWAARIDPASPLPEYPRPGLVREEWLNLNGLWEYAVAAEDASQPVTYEGKILVPFPLESALSGVRRLLKPEERLWYKRTFTVPEAWKGKRVLLNFEAVDYEAEVFVNGKSVGTHTGGYDPFSFDITDALAGDVDQLLVVRVYDPTEAKPIPCGKHSSRVFDTKKAGGIRYTQSSGIWQTVWLEPVFETSISDVKITPDVDRKDVEVRVVVNGGTDDVKAEVTVKDGSKVVIKKKIATGEPVRIAIETPKLWSPNSPFLYDLDVCLVKGESVLDRVGSYFGMRKIQMGDHDGKKKMLLNGEYVFQMPHGMGVLDQGFWPDGLHTPPSDDAMRWDIQTTKDHGFNTIRKHIKIEPRRWYYWCDKLGILVWQDAPSLSPRAGSVGRDGKYRNQRPSAEGRKNFHDTMLRMIDYLGNHPSIIMWVVFNEGWGQYKEDTTTFTNEAMAKDPTRIVNCASGWYSDNSGHVSDSHRYPRPFCDPADKRISVCGEYGGLNYIVKGSFWNPEGSVMRAKVKECNASSAEEFLKLYDDLMTTVVDLEKTSGMSAAIYTQLSDVENEPNGIVTYDRKLKFEPSKMRAINERIGG